MTTENTTTEQTTTETAAPAKKAAKKGKAKKAAKKATSKKAPKVSKPRGHKYELTDKGRNKLEADKISAQQKFILRELKKGPKSVATLDEAARGDKQGFPTTQPPKRAIAYYLTAWKNEGFVRFAKEA